MLLDKLAKAKSSQNNSPVRLALSGSKRATLEIFESFRKASDLNKELNRSTDEEIEEMLD